MEEQALLSTKSLVTKLTQVMGAIDKRIPKSGHNTNQNYDFVTEADVLQAVRGELAERNVMVVPVMTHCDRVKIEHSDKQSLTTVTLDYIFIDGDTDERLVVTMGGQGADAMDKAIFKAITGATKYCLLKTFLLPTGDDPEADEKTDYAAGKAAAQSVAKAKIEAHTQATQQSAPKSSANGSGVGSTGIAHITLSGDHVSIHPALRESITEKLEVGSHVALWRLKMDGFNVVYDVPTKMWVTDRRTLEVLAPQIEGLGYALKIQEKAPQRETAGAAHMVPPNLDTKLPPAGFTTHRILERKFMEKNGKAWWTLQMTDLEKKATLWDSNIGTFLEGQPAGSEIVCTLRPAKDPKYGPSVEKVFRINSTEFDEENRPVIQR